MPDYRIRPATSKDMDYIVNMADQEGWNPGLDCGQAWFAADNEGFLIGELDGKPIGCISAVRYQDFGFIGLYIVAPEQRGKGYGIKLWKYAMKTLSNCNIGLDGVVAQQENYRKSGFWLAHRNFRFAVNGKDLPKQPRTSTILETDTLPFQTLLAYDTQHFPVERRDFLKAWLSMRQSTTLAWVKDSAIMGLGTIYKCLSGWKIGPLFADNAIIAEALFLQLASVAGNEQVYLDIPQTNQNAIDITTKYNMKFVFETARMYTGPRPQAHWDEIYGITSFELG
jgi:N-acetylglutamate synthase-like GNAT family acetyltransferase